MSNPPEDADGQQPGQHPPQPPQGPGQPPSPYYWQPPAKKPVRGFGWKVLAGFLGTLAVAGIGLLGLVAPQLVGLVFIFIGVLLAVPIAAIVLMFFADSRPFAVGTLIAIAAIWITLFGVCVSALNHV